MRLEREMLIGKDAVLSWKNILASVLCIMTVGLASGNLSAQTTNQNYARPNQYYQSNQIADRSSFRERLATGETAARQNAGTETTRRPLTSSEIWSSFLFGGVPRQTSTMKFAFSRKTPNSGNLAATQNPQQSPAFNRNAFPSQSVYAPQNENQLAAMRQASESFNPANSSVTTPATPQNAPQIVQNEPYVAENRAVKRTSGASNAEERLQRIAELNAALDARASNAQPSSNDASNLAARANRAKIRQTSGLERQNPTLSIDERSTRNTSVIERETLPVRPQALQISPRVFVSTEVVQLPQAGALVEEAPDEETPEEDPLVAATQKEAKAPEVAPIEEESVYDIPTFHSQSEPQAEDAQIEVVAPTPLTPLPQATQTNGTNSRVLRSKAKFLDPRSI